jgi:hypothetical protein
MITVVSRDLFDFLRLWAMDYAHKHGGYSVFHDSIKDLSGRIIVQYIGS